MLRSVVPNHIVEDIAVFLEDELASLKRQSPGDAAEESLRIGHFPVSSRLNPRVIKAVQAPRLREILHHVFASENLRMHMPPMARFILPDSTTAPVPAHQDFHYNPHLKRFVIMWIPLMDIDHRCGGVTMFKGSKDADIPDAPVGLKSNVLEVPTDAYDAVDCVPMQAGDALLFTDRVIHRSMPNTSEKVRLSLDFRFFSEEVTSTKHYLARISQVVGSFCVCCA